MRASEGVGRVGAPRAALKRCACGSAGYVGRQTEASKKMRGRNAADASPRCVHVVRRSGITARSLPSEMRANCAYIAHGL